jgi:hypothetical protein
MKDHSKKGELLVIKFRGNLRYFFLLIEFIASLSLLSQEWTDPINISNMPGLDNQPDLCKDKNGKEVSRGVYLITLTENGCTFGIFKTIKH